MLLGIVYFVTSLRKPPRTKHMEKFRNIDNYSSCSPKGACATCSPKGACAMVHSFNGFEGGGGPLGALFLKSRNLKKRNILDNFYLMENPKIL